jgi:hypothetical protein
MILTVIFLFTVNIRQVSAQNFKYLASNGVKKENKIEKSGYLKDLKGLEGIKANNTNIKNDKEQKLLYEKFEYYLFGKYYDFKSHTSSNKPVLLWRKEGC